MSRRRTRPPGPGVHAESDEGILDLQHLTPEEELEHKRMRVELALRRRGLDHPVPPPLPSPRRQGARARVSLRVADSGRLVVHRPGSHEPVEPPLVAMARPEIVEAAHRIKGQLAQAPDLARRLERVELRSDGVRVVSVFYGQVPKCERHRLSALLAPAMAPDGAACLETRVLLGDPRLRLPLGELELEVGPTSFFQVNLEANAVLVADVVDAVMAFEPTRVLDLFGGAGNLSLPIAARGVPVELVESHPAAVKDARLNARRTGLSVEVCQEDAYRLQAGSRFFDVAVLDPPRKGAGPTMQAVCATRPVGIVLVSCHPPSLAKDLEAARAQGYRLERLALHDLFPLTSHVESLAVLTRGRGEPSGRQGRR
jgi:23S rRNA (uracil1939-C5)-methyltransferase